MFLEVFREIHLVFPDVVQVIRTRIVCRSFPSMTPQKSQFCSWNLRFYLTNSHGCCFNKNAQQFPQLIQALSRLNPHVGSLRLQSHSVLVNVQGLCSCLTSFFCFGQAGQAPSFLFRRGVFQLETQFDRLIETGRSVPSR